jgi:thiol:disulfide interchange protein
VKDHRNALLWALGWWLVRRQLKRRAAIAVAGVATGAAAQRGRLRAVLGALALVGLLAAALVAWRKLSARPGAPPPEPPPPEPPAETAAA